MSHVNDGTLHAYLDGECSDREREQIEQHLSSCDVCRERLGEARTAQRRASDLLAELQPGLATAPAWHELEARAAARRPTPPRRVWVKPSLAWAAAILIAFGLGWFSRSYLYRAPEPRALARLETESPSTTDRLEPAAETRPPSLPAAEEQAEPAAPTSAGRTAGAEQETLVQARTRRQPEAGLAESVAKRSELREDVAAQAERDQHRAAPAKEEEQVARPLAAVSRQRPAEEKPEVGAGDAPEPTRAVALTDEARPQDEVAGALAQKSALQAARGFAAGAESPTSFFNVQPDEARLWLGGELRRIPDLQLMSVEVGPGTAVAGGLAGLPVAKLTYADAAGHVLVLYQQRLGDIEVTAEDKRAAMVVEPSGMRTYRWHDDLGYRLILMGTVSGDSLRALAERVR